MEGNNVEHSDSDSGESWTMLDNSPTYVKETPNYAENPANHEGETPEQTDRDDDTDGISIISDSEPDSTTPCELITSELVAAECGDCPPDNITTQYDQNEENLPTTKQENVSESMRTEHDFLGDSSTKMRTYVHRRNKRLSTVLNIIVLGSLITAAGVAIGHMWGAEDCAPPPPPAVNKILSNLYKLQEENAYLRSKLKELTLANTILTQQQRAQTEKFKKCNKKGFEEGIIGNCEDFDFCSTDKVLESHMVEPEFEKEFIADLDKLRTVYKQNKSWLDEEVGRRQRFEEGSFKKMKSNLKMGKQSKITVDTKAGTIKNNIKDGPSTFNEAEHKTDSEGKISYADSLKSDKNNGKRHTSEASDFDNLKDQPKKKRLKRQLDVIAESMSDDEIKKDDRYVGIKTKEDKKKTRQKTNKKQKRRNKYEQWEMNGGYMKDYDDISLSSLLSQDIDAAAKAYTTPNNYVMINSANEWPREEEKTAEMPEILDKPKQETEKDNWYDKRMLQRSEARKKVEKEMFGESERGERGAAGWYFRRMRRREQRRRDADATRARHNKKNMNYKTKR